MRIVALVAIACAIIAAFVLTRVPVHWRATYANVPYDRMIACLEQTSAATHTVGQRANEQGNAATVRLYQRDSINLVGQYEVEKNGTGSNVAWRDVKAGLAEDTDLDRLARARADTCGKPDKASGS